MFFENDRIDPRAGKEKPEHHPGRAAADDAAAAGDCLADLVHRPTFHRSPERQNAALVYFSCLHGLRTPRVGNLKHHANENCNGNVPSGTAGRN
jgi:hypothetical protein